MNIYCKVKMLNQAHDDSLILNPTENIPWSHSINTDFLQGLYMPEYSRDANAKVIFGGRPGLNDPNINVYRLWENLLGTPNISMKYHSGLDAHIILFMSISEIGDKVLLLPETAGGHFSAQQILNRLGLKVIDFPIAKEDKMIDSVASMHIIEREQPRFIFIDRSEGLNYEDFSWLKKYHHICKIFDASQYLTHIIANDYVSPFKMGFDVVVSTLHKNYPGYQKAVVFTPEDSPYWSEITNGLNAYISNIHSKDIVDIILATPSKEKLAKYSQLVLDNAKELNDALQKFGVPVVERNNTWPSTQHIWIQAHDRDEAYLCFRRLEELHIFTNYRLLPYELGYGLRLGTAAATRQGMIPSDAFSIAEVIAKVWHERAISSDVRTQARKIIAEIRTHKEVQ